MINAQKWEGLELRATGRWRQVRPRGLVALILMILVVALWSCSKQVPTATAYQPANDPDPERSVENQLRQTLTQVISQEGNVAALARVVGGAPADRIMYYPGEEYIKSLRAADAAITNKMSALAMERAILANSKDTNVPGAPPPIAVQTNRAIPDERAEEMKLKGRLLELQSLNEELLITMPGAGQVSTPTEGKAALAREDMYSAEDYVARLRSTVNVLHKKLQALDAEADFYNKTDLYNKRMNSTNSMR